MRNEYVLSVRPYVPYPKLLNSVRLNMQPTSKVGRPMVPV